MQLAPKAWTHHHTLRLYHISRLMTFVFIVAAIVCGIINMLVVASGDTLSGGSNNLNITALVSGISEVPATPQANASNSGGVSYYTPYVFSPTYTLSMRMIPHEVTGTKFVLGSDGKEVGLPVLQTQYVEFSGTSVYKNAPVYIEVKNQVTIRSIVTTNERGEWVWRSEQPLFTGRNTIFAAVGNPENPKVAQFGSLDFFIELPVGQPVSQPKAKLIPLPKDYGNFFDVVLRIPSDFRKIVAGKEIVTGITLINFGGLKKPVNVTVEYKITNVQGDTILQSTEDIKVAAQLSLIKTFQTSVNLKPGVYMVSITVPSKNLIAVSSDIFEIIIPSSLVAATVKKENELSVVTMQWLISLLFLFAIVVYFEYEKITYFSRNIRKIQIADLKRI